MRRMKPPSPGFRHILLAGAFLAALGAAQSAGPGRAEAEAAYKAAMAATPGAKKCKACVAWARLEAANTLATATMYDPELPARVKYREALRLYRQVLARLPDHPEARANTETIVGIYQSMGREVPE
jgi:hypothetical protein